MAASRPAREGRGGWRHVHELGVFANDDELASAQGHFVHVCVDRVTRWPMPLPAELREALESIASATQR